MTSPPNEGLGYSALSPDVVLDLLDAVGLRGDGRVLQLNSFENRVFQVYLEGGGAVVAKFYRPGRWTDAQIVEEHTFAHELAAAEVPVAAPLILTGGSPVELAGDPATLALAPGGYRYAVTRCHSGRTPELDRGDTLQWIGRFIGRIHTVGARRHFAHRTALSAAVGDAARHAILGSGLLPEDCAPAWTASCDAALAEARRRIDEVGAQTLRLHGDCHRGNLLWSASGPHFVDLDDACNGPAMQDLWMLLDGDRDTARRQLAEFVAGYGEFRDFDRREFALIEPLRTLRLLHHSAWIARRWHDPAFPRAFPDFGSSAYWQQQAVDLRHQLDAMRLDPL